MINALFAVLDLLGTTKTTCATSGDETDLYEKKKEHRKKRERFRAGHISYRLDDFPGFPHVSQNMRANPDFVMPYISKASARMYSRILLDF